MIVCDIDKMYIHAYKTHKDKNNDNDKMFFKRPPRERIEARSYMNISVCLITIPRSRAGYENFASHLNLFSILFPLLNIAHVLDTRLLFRTHNIH